MLAGEAFSEGADEVVVYASTLLESTEEEDEYSHLLEYEVPAFRILSDEDGNFTNGKITEIWNGAKEKNVKLEKR